jgi:hypothetical protein
MRKTFIIIDIIFIMLIASSCSSKEQPTEPQATFPELSGPYLGQTPPGNSPAVFAAGVISANNNEFNLAEYPGGEEIYYVQLVDAGNQRIGKIVCTKIVNGYWTEPKVVPFSGVYSDAYIAIHPDGSRLYFQSNRPVNHSESNYEWNIWYVERVGNTWSEPKSMGKPINGINNVSGPSVTADGTMYFTIITIGGLSEIYRSKYANGTYQAPQRLPNNVNSVTQQFDSYIAPDESYLIFNVYARSDSYGGTDLYVSFRDSTNNWSSAVNLGSKINTVGDESSANITPNGKYIFFARTNIETKNSLDIYWVSSQIINNL